MPVFEKITLLWKRSWVGRGARASFQSGARRQTRRTVYRDVLRSYTAFRFRGLTFLELNYSTTDCVYKVKII